MSSQDSSNKSEEFCDQWILGYNECKAGIPHEDKGEAHKRGYATRYEQEQLIEKGLMK